MSRIMKKETALTILIAFISPAYFTVQGQCPVSTEPGIHVVQAGESLYQLSRKYGVSLAQLCEWNNMTINDVIPLCKKLRVAPASADAPPAEAAKSTAAPATKTTAYVKPFSEYRKQAGDNHVVDYGETYDNIARLYGYTSEKFREFNQLASTDIPYAGQVLSTCHCRQQEKGATPESNPLGAKPAASTAPGATAKSDKSEKTDPYEAEEKSKMTPSTPYKVTKASAAYMTNEELQMVDEINLVRADPAGYIPVVQAYIDDLRTNGEFGNSIATAYDLIDELKSMAPLPVLQPSECIYRATKRHGDQQKATGDVNHQGIDGTWPWDRVLRECPQLQDGNENIVGGPTDIRKSVLLLLVDDGIDNRGHRRNLLDPKWQYVACYKIGQVGSIPNNWLQCFGY